MTPRRIGWFLSLQDILLTTTAHIALESSTKKRLEDVCTFLFHNLDILQDPSKWPVKHTVQQLSSEEVDTVCGEKYADRDKATGESRFITLISKREKHLCRNIHHESGPVRSLSTLLLTRRIETGTWRGEWGGGLRCMHRFCSEGVDRALKYVRFFYFHFLKFW